MLFGREIPAPVLRTNYVIRLFVIADMRVSTLNSLAVKGTRGLVRGEQFTAYLWEISTCLVIASDIITYLKVFVKCLLNVYAIAHSCNSCIVSKVAALNFRQLKNLCYIQSPIRGQNHLLY